MKKEKNNVRTKKSNLYFASKLYLDVLCNELKYGLILGLIWGIIGTFIPSVSKILESSIGVAFFSLIIGIYAVKITIEQTMNNSVVLKEQIINTPIIMAIIQLILSIALLSINLLLSANVSIVSFIVGVIVQYIPLVAVYIFLKEQYNKDINNNIIPENCESENPSKMRRWVIINIVALFLIFIALFFFISKAIEILKSGNI